MYRFGVVTSVFKVYGKRRRKRRTELGLLVASLLAFSTLPGLRLTAQVSGGSLSGTVTDASQTAIPDVRITLTNVATGMARTVATNPAGLYTVPNHLPGSYDMTATAPGFTTEVRTDITV